MAEILPTKGCLEAAGRKNRGWMNAKQTLRVFSVGTGGRRGPGRLSLKLLTRQDHQWQSPQKERFPWKPYFTIFRCTAMDFREEVLKFSPTYVPHW